MWKSLKLDDIVNKVLNYMKNQELKFKNLSQNYSIIGHSAINFLPKK